MGKKRLEGSSEILVKTISDSSQRPVIDDILRKHNLSIDDLVKCGKEGLLATKEINGYDEDGESRTIPDYNVRHKYFDSFMNLLGYLKPSSINIQNVQISKEENDLLDSYRRVEVKK